MKNELLEKLNALLDDVKKSNLTGPKWKVEGKLTTCAAILQAECGDAAEPAKKGK